jgi:hypothetical protein
MLGGKSFAAFGPGRRHSYYLRAALGKVLQVESSGETGSCEANSDGVEH